MNKPSPIPQVVDIVRMKGSHEITIKKDLRRDFDTDNNPLYVAIGNEVLLSNHEMKGAQKVLLENNRIHLANDVRDLLKLEKGSHVAMIEREQGLALKKLVIEDWLEGDKPQILDRETPHTISRSAVRVAWPEDALPRLEAECKGLLVSADVRTYLRGRDTFWAWRARELIGMHGESDETVRRSLVQARTDNQQDNGSWNDSVMETAKHLRELIELGVLPDAKPVQRASEWLLLRPESPHKPGAFLLTDDLVDELDICVEKGKTKPGKHFRERTKPDEKILAASGDDMFSRACGPRFLWPNAKVIEALTLAGYGDHRRVRDAVAATVGSDWCECHITYDGAPRVPTQERLQERIDDVKRKYRHGGLNTLQELGILALSRKCDFQTRRVSHHRDGDTDVYEIAPKKGHSGPCGMVLARSLSCVKDDVAQKWLEPRLWGHGPGPVLRYGGNGYLHSQAAMDLDTIARFDHPVTRMRLMIAVPDIIRTQNSDGSWGREPHVDMTTHAVLRALLKAGDFIPPEKPDRNGSER